MHHSLKTKQLRKNILQNNNLMFHYLVLFVYDVVGILLFIIKNFSIFISVLRF